MPKFMDFEVDLRSLERALIQFEPLVNSELNRFFETSAGAFYKRFKPRLTGAGIRVRRKVKSSDRRVPAVAAAMGFRASLRNRKNVVGKEMVLFSGSPVIKAHEFGATIKPRRGNLLAIGKGMRFVKAGGFNPMKHGRVVRRVRSVTLKPRLGFYSTWRAFRPELQRRLEKAVERIETRANELEFRKAGFRGSMAQELAEAMA